MQSLNPIEAREALIMKIAESKKDLVALRQHLKDIVEGPAFNGSHRSAQFLSYVVEQSIAGQFDSLKERLIGVELFGRNPSYDTGGDAIVRVTASDVRRRLLRHYDQNGLASKLRINLPSGSYVPEITQERDVEDHSNSAIEVARHLKPFPKDSTPNRLDSPAAPEEQESVAVPLSVPHVETSPSKMRSIRKWLLIGCLLAAAGPAFWGFSWNKFWPRRTQLTPILPWSVLFRSPEITHLITSDPKIVVIQQITGSNLSVSDYANRQYIPEPNDLTPEEIRFCHMILWGDDSAAAVDPPIAAKIAALAEENSRTISVQAARGIQVADLKTNDNFILLGSPRSNPWSALFDKELDFRFIFDKTTRAEIIQNVHPRPGEQAKYVPTAQGWTTGQSYAIIAFIQNLDQQGQVLLLAGLSGEGTEAAGRFVTDAVRLSDALHACGIQPGGPLKHFEILLRLSTMAGSPTTENVVTCHVGT